jgi:predicted O-methyltransferase YrrM
MNDDFTKTALLSQIRRISGWLSSHEAFLLYELAKNVSIHGEIVEIGSYKGKSTVALAYGLLSGKKEGSVWAIDPHKGVIACNTTSNTNNTFHAFQKNIKEARVEHVVRPVVATSKAAAKSWKKPIRLLFIDGLHDAYHAREDYLLWSSWVPKGGVIAFHDGFCGEPGVWSVIQSSVFKRKDIADIGTVSSILYIVLGKPKALSALCVRKKKALIRCANWLYKTHAPWMVKKAVIHICIRLLLFTRYTLRVYTR